MADCIFCAIVAGEAPSEIIYEDDDTIAFLDISQATEGHTLVIPRAHCADIFDIGPARAAAVMRATIAVAELLERTLSPGGITLAHASRSTAWQTVFHFHMHVVPRYRFDDLNLPWIPRQLPLADLAPLAERIRAAL